MNNGQLDINNIYIDILLQEAGREYSSSHLWTPPELEQVAFICLVKTVAEKRLFWN